MKSYNTEWIRNVGIAGHGDTGKTQLVSSLLFTAGMTPRLGKVAEGSTVTDWDEEEIARKITINTGLAYAEWQAAGPSRKNKDQFSGYARLFHVHQRNEVVADRRRRVADRGGRAAGVQVVTEKVWDYATEYDQPRAFVLNWMDRELASFERALDSIAAGVRPRRGAHAVAHRRGERLSRRGGPDHHEGADLHAGWRRQSQDRRDSRRPGRRREGRARSAGRNGGRRRRRADAGIFRRRHAARRGFEERACARRSCAKRIFPVLLSSALHNIGSDAMLNFIVRHFPVAVPRAESAAATRRRTTRAKPSSARSPTPSRSRIFVFKTLADPFAGRITYFKVMSGVLKNDATLHEFQSRFAGAPPARAGDAGKDRRQP